MSQCIHYNGKGGCDQKKCLWQKKPGVCSVKGNLGEMRTKEVYEPRKPRYNNANNTKKDAGEAS